MSDATERGGALADVYRSIKKKDGTYERIDRTKAQEMAKKGATSKSSGRNQPAAIKN